METIVNRRLLKHLESNNLLSDRQYGFRSGRSTADILTLLTHRILSSVAGGGESTLSALDISKAFDRVWHLGLTTKLPAFGLDTFFIKWIDSFLSDRQIRVNVEGVSSGFHSINAGVPQGSVLVPTLFLMHINDLLELPAANSTYSYADDTSILHCFGEGNSRLTVPEVVAGRSDANGSLSNDLLAVRDWSERNLVTFNPSKTKLLRVSHKKDDYASSMSFDGSPLPESSSVNVLGMGLNDAMHFGNHIKDIVRTASQRLGFLFTISRYFEPHHRLALYKGIVRPHLEYCSSLP